jgi:thymidylate synthase
MKATTKHAVKINDTFISRFIGSSANELFYELITTLRDSGGYPPNGTVEIISPQIVLEDPQCNLVTLAGRDLNIVYPMTEFVWYLTGNRKANEIQQYAKIWGQIADSSGEVESNYGDYIFNVSRMGFSQWSWCIDELSKEPASRRAVLNILAAHHKKGNPKDIPCTASLQFLIRDSKLHMIVNMRSQDVIFGWCNDTFCFSMFHQLMYNELLLKYPNLTLGIYIHNAASLHIYERHYRYLLPPMLETMLNSLRTPPPSTPHNDRVQIASDVTYRKIFDEIVRPTHLTLEQRTTAFIHNFVSVKSTNHVKVVTTER